MPSERACNGIVIKPLLVAYKKRLEPGFREGFVCERLRLGLASLALEAKPRCVSSATRAECPAPLLRGPAPAASSPPHPSASAPRASAVARAPREPLRTRTRTHARGLHPSAPRRPTLRRAGKISAEPHAHPDVRRTFHEPRGPPGTDAERACQDRAIRPHQWHATPWRPAKPSQSAMSRAPAEPSLTRPGASVPRAGAVAHAPREPAHTPTARRRLAPLHPAPSDAAPRRSNTQAGAAPFTSRADHQGPTRSAREVCHSFDGSPLKCTQEAPPEPHYMARRRTARGALFCRRRDVRRAASDGS